MSRRRTLNLKCTDCGRQMLLKAYDHHEKVGEFTVSDRTCQAQTCVCGNRSKASLSAADLQEYEWRAAVLVLIQGKSVSGQVLKAARKTLGLRQKEFAKLLQCNEQQVSRWENAAVIDRTIQLATVALLMVKLDRIGESRGRKMRVSLDEDLFADALLRWLWKGLQG